MMKNLLSVLILSVLVLASAEATIVGITTTADNGIERLNDNQNVGSGVATIDGETIVLGDGNDVLEASGTGEIIITNSQIKLDSDVTGGNDAGAVLNYGGRAVTTAAIRIQDNSTVLAGPFTGRKNIQISELSGRSAVEEADGTGQLFVYTQTDAILNEATFRGINVWEVYRPPSVAFGIEVDDANYGYLNWEAGRLDFIGFAVSNVGISDAWLGNGNGGNNSAYHWNNVAFDSTNIRFQSGNGRYYEGYTASWEFLDQISAVPINDVLVVYRDDRAAPGGTRTELGRYTTNVSGHLTGTYDSQFETTGASQERGALFVRTAQSNIAGSSFSSGGGNTYDIDTVTPEVEVRSYAHEAASGFETGDTLSLSQQVGEINADGSVKTYSRFFLTPDEGVTSTQAVALGLGTLTDLNDFYDRVKAEWSTNDNFPLITKDGTIADLGSTNVVIDATAPTAYNYAAGTNTITINSSALNESSKFNRLRTTGTITRVNGATLGTALLQDSVGTTGRLTLTGVDTANVLVYNDADAGDATISYQTNQTGSISIPFDATSSTDYQVVVRRQGYSEVNFEFDPSGGGLFEFPISQFRSLTIEGTPIYANSGDLTKVTMDFTGLRINVGDFTIGAQEFYDTLQDYEATEDGMKAPRIMNYDGNDKLLLLNTYQIRSRDGGGTVPGVNGFIFAETGGVLDASNGTVQFLVNDTATVDKQEQIINMLERIQGSTWDNNAEVYTFGSGNLTDIAGAGFDPNTDSLGALVQSMLDDGITDVNTMKDLVR